MRSCKLTLIKVLTGYNMADSDHVHGRPLHWPSEGKCLLEKSWGEVKYTKLVKLFSVANCLETHGTECDNSTYNTSIFSARFAGRIL